MSAYAYVFAGVVVEIIGSRTDHTGNEIPVADCYTPQFVAGLIDITSVSPQPANGWAYNGSTFSAPAVTPVSAIAAATEALSSGLTVSSAGAPSLNGIYAVDQLSQMDIIAIETSLNAGKGFPGGAAMFSYADTAGVAHSFTEANFTDFAAAVRDYVYALKSVIAGASTTLPSTTSTIA